jgi:hypothetical protein
VSGKPEPVTEGPDERRHQHRAYEQAVEQDADANNDPDFGEHDVPRDHRDQGAGDLVGEANDPQRYQPQAVGSAARPRA